MKTIDFSKIDDIMDRAAEMLRSDKPISDDDFTPIAGSFTGELKNHLRKYHKLSREEKERVAPKITYYRLVQHYFSFILRFPDILSVPHHSEIEQTLKIIENKNHLLETKYKKLAQQKFQLLEGDFKQKLEGLFEKRESHNQ